MATVTTSSPDAAMPRRRTQGDHGIYGSRGDQFLASAERHDSVAHPRAVSDPEVVLRAEFLAGRPADAHPDADRIAAPAGRRSLHGPPARAVFARRRHGLFAGRLAAAVGGRDVWLASRGGRTGRHRFVGVSSRVVADRAHGLRRAATVWRSRSSRSVGMWGRHSARCWRRSWSLHAASRASPGARWWPCSG